MTMNCSNPECEVGGEVSVGCLDSNGMYFVFCPDCYMQGPLRDTKNESIEAYRNGVGIKEVFIDNSSFYVE